VRTLGDSPIASVSQPSPLNTPIPSEANPTVAAALFAAWSGDPAVVVASPPGAGKTSLVVQLADQLNRRAGLSVAIAAQTRVQALDVTNRAARIGASVALLGTRDSHRPLDLEPRAHYLAGVADLRRWPGVVVATTARWLWVHEREYTAEVCVCDEAWQMTWADLGGLGPLSAQVVLVGDPGQIAPVVTGDSRRWEHLPAAPQRAAPEALLAAYPESVTRLRLPCTWRLGPDTTALIQPAFYADLPFESARPPRHVELRGAALPEIGLELQSPLAGPGDACPAAAAANRVRDLLQGGAIVEGSERSRALEPRDLAVITPHVEQASAVTARLADVPGVLIGTANQAQGLEREAVVVIHPLAGYREAPSFATDPGRLCVALSRHRAHVTVICDVGTEAVLQHALADAPNDTALGIQRHVLAGLLRTADDGLYLTQGG